MPKQGTSAKKSPKLKGVAAAHLTLVTEMISAMAPYAVKCAETAAMMGAAKGNKPGNLSAAKTVMDFIANHSEPGGDSEVAKILEGLKAAAGQSSSMDDEVPAGYEEGEEEFDLAEEFGQGEVEEDA